MSNDMVQRYVAELLDRLLRLDLHLTGAENELLMGARSVGTNTEREGPLLFLAGFRNCVNNLLREAQKLAVVAHEEVTDEASHQLMLLVRHGFMYVNQLH